MSLYFSYDGYICAVSLLANGFLDLERTVVFHMYKSNVKLRLENDALAFTYLVQSVVL